MKKIIRILQIGDVHFPDAKNSSAASDVKDDGILSSFADKLSSNSFQESTRKMLSILESKDIDLLAFMGDLTSRGCLDGYSDCLEFLSKGLRVNAEPLIEKEKIIIVAGNHDVCRNTAINNPDNKFNVLSNKLTSSGFREITVKSIDCRCISKPGYNVQVYGINTCIGCGEKRFLPERIRDAIYNQIDSDLSDSEIDNNDVLHDLYEQIDAPAIHHETISELAENIGALTSSELGVIVAHHNLLPQSRPRIDTYTELINSGSLRSTLGELGKPIIFLHGHIHTDPIEIVSNPVLGKKPLICISAPAFDDGFNLLEIAFDSSQKPLGCRVHFYRANSAGFIINTKEAMVPFGGVSSRVLDNASSMFVSLIIRQQTLTWRDFKDKLEEEYADQSMNDEQIVEKLEELYWHGLISIENLDQGHSNWRIGSVIG